MIAVAEAIPFAALTEGSTARLYALKQRPRERTKARADLDEVVVRVQMQRGDDPIDVMPIDQEMLAEALARK